MLLPESMSRVVIVGDKSRMDMTIEAMYKEKDIHIIDHTTGDDNLLIGKSRPYMSKASERLLKVKGMEASLGVNKHTKTDKISVKDIKTQIESGKVEEIENIVVRSVDKKDDLAQRITELNAKKNIFEILNILPLDLEMYSGYKTMSVKAGTVIEDPTDVLNKIDGVGCFSSITKEKNVIAVFSKNESENKVAAILTEKGFTEMKIPEGIGNLSELIPDIQKNIDKLKTESETVNDELKALGGEYKHFLRAAEEELTIAVQKGGVPLRIAESEYTYVMDAWVPTVKTESLKSNLESKIGGTYVEIEETRGRSLKEEEAVEDRFKTAPTFQKNGKISKEFKYATNLVSVPKYHEIDPTILVTIFLPLFFGFMVGDCGYSIPFIILGAYGLKYRHNKDWRSIGVVLFFGGIWAFIFGLLFYGEALGMHFIGGFYDASNIWTWHASNVAVGGTSVSWDWILGVQFPDWFSGIMPHVIDNEAGVGKLEAVGFLLKLSVYIGIVHLMVGYVCGYINTKMQSGNKAAFINRGGLMMTFIGMVTVCYVLTDILFNSNALEGNLVIIMAVGLVILIAGLAVNMKSKGGLAIMDVPEVVGNVLSYTRLGAIAMSKAGMALAFNYIVFTMIFATTTIGAFTTPDFFGNIPMLILGILLFAFLHLVVWVLAILSGGLHALRLQYVEMMTKFFDGNGVAFKPLRVNRVNTFFSENMNNVNNVKEA